mmetsp:Transcript_24221/g.35887  ORF Transcript_24221/g.35887 Transcript_24221/m.35887 type:complete len:248 (-) Transcript_24221:1024-1767(-)
MLLSVIFCMQFPSTNGVVLLDATVCNSLILTSVICLTDEATLLSCWTGIDENSLTGFDLIFLTGVSWKCRYLAASFDSFSFSSLKTREREVMEPFLPFKLISSSEECIAEMSMEAVTSARRMILCCALACAEVALVLTLKSFLAGLSFSLWYNGCRDFFLSTSFASAPQRCSESPTYLTIEGGSTSDSSCVFTPFSSLPSELLFPEKIEISHDEQLSAPLILLMSNVSSDVVPFSSIEGLFVSVSSL